MLTAANAIIATDQDGVGNCVSIDRVTKIPRRPRELVAHSPTTDTDAAASQGDVEYAIDCIVEHLITRESVQYRVRWYGYTPEKDTFEPADGLSQASIDRYWRSHSEEPATRPLRRARIADKDEKFPSMRGLDHDSRLSSVNLSARAEENHSLRFDNPAR